MMINTSDLIRRQLDWAVAKALGHETKIRSWKDITDTIDPVEDADMIEFHRANNTVSVSSAQIPGGGWFPTPKYSTDWAHGGPIIDREIHNLFKWNQLDPSAPEMWCGVHNVKDDSGILAINRDGPTPLIAAMRCFVASKLGDVIDMPDELAQA